MQSHQDGGCANPRCPLAGTEKYRGPNGNTIEVCEKHYYKLVSGSGMASPAIDSGDRSTLGVGITDDGMRLFQDDDPDDALGAVDLEHGCDYTITIVDEAQPDSP